MVLKKKPNMENLWCKHRCEILPVREPHVCLYSTDPRVL